MTRVGSFHVDYVGFLNRFLTLENSTPNFVREQSRTRWPRLVTVTKSTGIDKTDDSVLHLH